MREMKYYKNKQRRRWQKKTKWKYEISIASAENAEFVSPKQPLCWFDPFILL